VSLVGIGGGFLGPAFVPGTSFWGAQTGGWSSQDKYPRLIADVTGDGLADIVGFAQNGVYVSLATGTGGFSAPAFANGTSFWGTQTGGWSSQNLFPRELADVNGDGMADLVGFAQSGVYVSLATRGGNFAAPALVPNTSFWGAQTGNWSSNDLYPRELANITTGDTKADIVGFTQSGVWTSISTSTLTPSAVSMLDPGSPSGGTVGSVDTSGPASQTLSGPPLGGPPSPLTSPPLDGPLLGGPPSQASGSPLLGGPPSQTLSGQLLGGPPTLPLDDRGAPPSLPLDSPLLGGPPSQALGSPLLGGPPSQTLSGPLLGGPPQSLTDGTDVHKI
jgi:hypothetical protein